MSRRPRAGTTAASSSPSDPVLSLTTTMLSYTPVNVTPGALAAGDGYVIAGMVSGPGGTGGLSTAQCTFTDTKGPVLRVCTVDYADAHGYGLLQPDATGSHVTLHLTH